MAAFLAFRQILFLMTMVNSMLKWPANFGLKLSTNYTPPYIPTLGQKLDVEKFFDASAQTADEQNKLNLNPFDAKISNGCKSGEKPEIVNDQKLEEVRIRAKFNGKKFTHAYVVVGDYEYDYTTTVSRRKKFRHDLDKKWDSDDKRKTQSFKGQKLFVPMGKAEAVFFMLSERFWFKDSYQYNQANCLDYIVNFVYALFDWDCPPKAAWPDNFVEFDQSMLKEYSKELNIKYSGGVRDPRSALDREPIKLPKAPNDGCMLVDHELEFEIGNLKNELKNDEKLVVLHFTGRHDLYTTNIRQLRKQILVMTDPVEVEKMPGGDTLKIKVILKAYDCCGHLGKPKSLVANLLILDQKTKHYMKLNEPARKMLDFVNLYDLTNRVVHAYFEKWDTIEFGN